MQYKEWLDNEYGQWAKALSESTVYNVKTHPVVKRMLGDPIWPDNLKLDLSQVDQDLIVKIDNVGKRIRGSISGACWRMLYYADLVLKDKPSSIVEIGGGLGQFFAIMKALGYSGNYFIYDLPEVKAFQQSYLSEIERQTGLNFNQVLNHEYCVSFYALGEFDDELKKWYIEHVVSHCPHGLIAWNPHSGATSEIPLEWSYKVGPQIEKGVSIISW